MMMVNNVEVLFRSADGWNHVPTEKPYPLLFWKLPPAVALFVDLSHADRNLRRSQILDRHGMENGLSNHVHWRLLKGLCCFQLRLFQASLFCADRFFGRENRRFRRLESLKPKS